MKFREVCPKRSSDVVERTNYRTIVIASVPILIIGVGIVMIWMLQEKNILR